MKSCMHCIQYEGGLSKVPLHPIVSTTPMDILHVDFTSIMMTMELNRPPKVTNVLVFQYHFTKHIMACMTPNQTTKTVAKFLYQGYILIFGAPAMLLSDHNVNFMSNIISEMCKLLRVKKLQTMPYHPPDEWVGRQVPSNYHADDWEAGRRWKANWLGHLAEIVQAYNATPSIVMGFSPHYLNVWAQV